MRCSNWTRPHRLTRFPEPLCCNPVRTGHWKACGYKKGTRVRQGSKQRREQTDEEDPHLRLPRPRPLLRPPRACPTCTNPAHRRVTGASMNCSRVVVLHQPSTVSVISASIREDFMTSTYPAPAAFSSTYRIDSRSNSFVGSGDASIFSENLEHRNFRAILLSHGAFHASRIHTRRIFNTFRR